MKMETNTILFPSILNGVNDLFVGCWYNDYRWEEVDYQRKNWRFLLPAAAAAATFITDRHQFIMSFDSVNTNIGRNSQFRCLLTSSLVRWTQLTPIFDQCLGWIPQNRSISNRIRQKSPLINPLAAVWIVKKKVMK